MPQERIKHGVRIAGLARMHLNIDKQRKPEFPLHPTERTRLERENEQILKKEDFGRDYFERFRENMLLLARKENDPEGFARLHDKEGGMHIDIGTNSISLRTEPWYAEENPSSNLYENFSYSAQKMEAGFFGWKLSDIRPTLTTNKDVSVPSSITFFSYFKGRLRSAFPKGTHTVQIEGEEVSDKDVHDFCKRVYIVYNSNKTGINFPPQ